MLIDQPIHAGEYICLSKAFKDQNWTYECMGSLYDCTQRANNVMGCKNGRSAMIVTIVAIATPSMDPVWTSALGEKIVKG